MTYAQLLEQYKRQGGQVNTPQEQQAFNSWTNNIMQTLGVGDWESITPDAFVNGAVDPATGGPGRNAPAAGGGGTPPAGGGGSTPPPDNGGGGGVTPPPAGGGGTPPPASGGSGGGGVAGGGNSGLGGAIYGLVGAPTSGNFVVDPANDALNLGAIRAQAGGNTNQVSGSTQVGNLSGVNDQSATQTNHATGSTNGATTENTQQNGTQAGTRNTSSDTSMNQTSGVAHDLGLSGLVQSEGQMQGASDVSRNNFLRDVQDNGGTGFQQQLDAGIRQSLSGPGMVGVGDEARGRAAGTAAADIGRNNLNQRLDASRQLSGPTGVSTLAQGAGSSGLLGSTTTGSTSNLGSELSNLVSSNASNSAGTSAQTNLTDAINATQSHGTNSSAASGSSLGVSTGQTPEQKSSGGGCFVSTVYVDKGLLAASTVRRAVKSKLSKIDKYEDSINGYMVWGPAVSRCVAKIPLVLRLLERPVRAILYEEIRLSNDRIKSKLSARLWHSAFHYGNYICYPFRRKTTSNPVTVAMLNRNNLNFQGGW